MCNDEIDLNAWLDLHPGDAVTRLALADWYEERSRMPDAEGQRWLVANEKWPVAPWEYKYDKWQWWWLDEIDCPLHGRIPEAIYQYFAGGESGVYDTRREAEGDLIHAAREAGLIPRMEAS